MALSLLLAAALACSSVLLPGAAAKMRGFNFNGYATGPSSFTAPLEATYGRLMDISIAGADPIGAPWWGHLNPAPGVYNWTGLDAIVATVRAANPNLCLLFPIWGTPTWLASDKRSCAAGDGDACSRLVFQSFPGANTLPTDLAPWRDFVTALVTRYSVQQDVFYAYEVWNEPTNAMFLNSTHFTAKDWELLAQMHYVAHDVVKTLTKNTIRSQCLLSSDPNLIGAYVIGASLIFDGNAHMASLADAVLQGLTSYKAAAKLDYFPFDAMACHVYDKTQYDAANLTNYVTAAAAWGALLDQCCAVLHAHGMPHPDQPWITELGYTVDQDWPQYDGEFAYQLTAATYIQAWQRHDRNIANLFWYSWDLQQGGTVFNEVGGLPSPGFQSVINNAP